MKEIFNKLFFISITFLFCTIAKADTRAPIEYTFSSAASGAYTSMPINVTNYNNITIQLSGTWSATVTFEASINGTDYFSVSAASLSSPPTVANTATANGGYYIPANFKLFRLNNSSYSSGTVSAKIRTSYNEVPSLFTSSSIPTISADSLDVVYSGTTALPVKRAVITTSTSGNNTVVAAVASKKITVIGAFCMASGSVNIVFQDGAGGSSLSPTGYLTASNGYVLPQSTSAAWFQGSTNTLLNLNLSAATATSCLVTYVEV